MALIDLLTLPGDGVGPEVTEALVHVLGAVAARYDHELDVALADIGWAAYKTHGRPLPAHTLRAAEAASAVFMGAIGDPRGAGLEPELRPEAGILELRRALGCFANLRPTRVDADLLDLSPLRPSLAANCDVLVVRELTGGLFYGEPRGRTPDRAFNTLSYTEAEVERIARVALEEAQRRRRHVTSVDKANVLEVSQLWRDVVDRVRIDFADVELDHMYVDRAAMELLANPARFDVILTSNLFGDVLSDEASAIAGSTALSGSASIGGTVGIYEPVHGPMHQIAGQATANPIGAIRAGGMMLSRSFGLEAEAAAVESAVTSALGRGLRTSDLTPGGRGIGTMDFAQAVALAIA